MSDNNCWILMGGYLEKRACTLLKAYFRERPFSLAKKTFFSPSPSLRLFEQLRYGQSCKGSKNHPQRHYPQVFWVMDTSSHFVFHLKSASEFLASFSSLVFLLLFVLGEERGRMCQRV